MTCPARREQASFGTSGGARSPRQRRCGPAAERDPLAAGGRAGRGAEGVALPGAAPLLQLRKELIRAQGAGGSGAARGPPGRRGGRGTPAGLPAGRGSPRGWAARDPPGPGPRPPRPGADNGRYCAPAGRRAQTAPSCSARPAPGPRPRPARHTRRPSPPAAGGASAGARGNAGPEPARTHPGRCGVG